MDDISNPGSGSGQPRPPAPPGPPNGPRPPGPQDRSRSRSTTVLWIVVAVLVVLVAMLFDRLWALEQNQQGLMNNPYSSMGPASGFGETTTVPPPVDLPPPDGDVARRSIVAAWQTAFSSEVTAEQRAAVFSEPGDLPARIEEFRTGRCVEAKPVVTSIRFNDDNSAWVQYRFEGVDVGLTFDGIAFRGPDGWVIEPGGVDSLLKTAASYCGVTTTTMG